MDQITSHKYHSPALDFACTSCSSLPLMCIPEITLIQRWFRSTLVCRRTHPWRRESLARRRLRWRGRRVIKQTETDLPHLWRMPEILKIQRWFRSLNMSLLQRALREWARIHRQLKIARVCRAFEDHTGIAITGKNWVICETGVVEITILPRASKSLGWDVTHRVVSGRDT